MQSKDAEIIDQFLADQHEAGEIVERWIVQAARPFQRRLTVAWEDVLQDLRLEVTRLLRAGQFRGASSLRTYLSRVVCHSCLDRLRARKKRHWVDLETLMVTGEAALTDTALTSPPEAHRKQESKDLLTRVMAEMSADCRGLWSMIFEGFSYREMSEHSRVSEGTLRVRVLRCRKKATEVRDRILDVRRKKARNADDVSTPIQNMRNG